MSEIFSEGNYLSDWLKGEAEDPDRYVREDIIVLAAEDLDTGAVLGKISASGKYVGWDPDAHDGSETVAGILITGVEGDTSIDQPSAAVTRGPARINAAGLSWITSVGDDDKVTALAALKALGIVAGTGA